MNDLQEYLKGITDFGFKQVLHENFDTVSFGSQYHEQQFVFWHPRGLLLAFHTYMETCINAGYVYYNWKPNAPLGRDWFDLTSSGGFRNGIWVGDHDCRTGMLPALQAMIDNGEFLPVWEQPHLLLWLLNYSENDNNSLYDSLIAARIRSLPEHVQAAIAVSADRYLKETAQ